jgi:hypothetical protein
MQNIYYAHQEIKEEEKISINKSKFLNMFYLYSGFVKKYLQQCEDECASMDQYRQDTIDIITCNHKWPVCTLDFSYKNKISEYFIFRVVTGSYTVIDDYYYGS